MWIIAHGSRKPVALRTFDLYIIEGEKTYQFFLLQILAMSCH